MKAKEKLGWDVIESLTKVEIILFLKTKWYCPPSQHDVDFFKWEITSDKLQKEMDKYLADDAGMKIANEIDKLGGLINTEKNPTKQLRLLSKRSALFAKYQAHHIKWEKIEAKQRKNDAFYESVVKPGYASGQ